MTTRPEKNGKHDHDHAHDHGHQHAHAHDHDHDHGHQHGHAHSDARSTREHPTADIATAHAAAAIERRQSTRLVVILLLISAFFVVELIGAKLARSDVLEADAFHLLMDVFALAISIAAMRLASRSPSARFTFGLRRAEPLAAIANGVLVLGVAVELVRDAISHIGHTSAPRSELMLGFATAALLVNGLNAWLLHGAMGHGHHGHAHAHAHGHDHDHGHDHGHDPEDKRHKNHLNMRGAWLHLLGDALGSVAAFGAGLAIRLGASPIVDPLASFVVVAILVLGALRLLRDAGLVVIEAAPAHLPVDKVTQALLSVEGITHVRSLHVWSLGTGHDVITAHVRASSPDAKLCAKACGELRKQFTVEYVTVQIDHD
jgi:cation diffusion facilitator family transporter